MVVTSLVKSAVKNLVSALKKWRSLFFMDKQSGIQTSDWSRGKACLLTLFQHCQLSSASGLTNPHNQPHHMEDSDDSEIHICEECCKTDRCNTNLCGMNGIFMCLYVGLYISSLRLCSYDAFHVHMYIETSFVLCILLMDMAVILSVGTIKTKRQRKNPNQKKCGINRVKNRVKITRFTSDLQTIFFVCKWA